jgi:hypothetical protein
METWTVRLILIAGEGIQEMYFGKRLTSGWAIDAAMHDAVPAIVAAGASPLVRIAGVESWMVKRK